MQQYKLRHRDELRLNRFGLAVSYFPKYVNPVGMPHGLDVVLLTFIVKGKGRHIQNEQSVEILGGSVGITYFGDVHTITTDADGMEIYNILLDPEYFQMPSLPPPLNDILHVILPQERGFRNVLNRFVHLELPNADDLAGLVSHLRRELYDDSPSPYVVNACISLFLAECCRAALKTGIQSTVVDGAPAWIDTIRRHLDTHYRDDIALDDLASLVRMSRGYICRAFKGHCGQSIFDYLIERRVQAAMLMLRTTDEQVVSIAMACGFNDLSHFNRTFRQRVNCTPLEYRRRHLPVA